MTKDKFLFELVDQCMLITCQDNILLENFSLRDDNPYYEENEKQFRNCLKFYTDMMELRKRGEISETVMDQELYSVLVLLRQRALRRLLQDFQLYLEQAGIENINLEIEKLENDFWIREIDSEYLLAKIKDYRMKELAGKEE